MSYDELEDEEFDADRYDTAVGWSEPDPADPYRKQKEAARKKRALENCTETMLDLRPASRWISRETKPEPTDLLGTLWHPGEVAMLCGETGIGKSIFAMHVAEAIARGRELEPFAAPAPRRVLYLDFRQTEDQFTRRYTCPRTAIGNHRIRYRFSGRLKRSGFSEAFDIPAAFDGDAAKYFIHSVNLSIVRSRADVIIIDDLAYLAFTRTGSSILASRMRSLKLLAAESGKSILVVANTKPKRRKSSPPAQGVVGAFRGRVGKKNYSPFTAHCSLSDLDPQISALADSVFAIARSTFGPDVRYLKHLKSTTSENTHDAQNVLTYRLERTAGPRCVRSPHVSKGTPATENAKLNEIPSKSSPPYEGAVAAASADGVVLSSPGSQLSVISSRLSPFLGFTFLGHSTESDHHRDYASEALLAEQAHQRALRQLWKRNSKEILVDAVIDGSYARYLRS